MFFLKKKKNPHETSCFVCHVLVAVILFVTVIASLLGVVMAHYDLEERIIFFGSIGGSLSLLALAVTITLLMHAVKGCMGKCEVCATNGKK